MSKFKAGDRVIVARNIGTVRNPERYGGADGYRVAFDGESMTRFAQDWTVKPAKVGETICSQPYGSHWCGLLHVADPSKYV